MAMIEKIQRKTKENPRELYWIGGKKAIEGQDVETLESLPGPDIRWPTERITDLLRYEPHKNPATAKPRSSAKAKRLRHLTAGERKTLERRWGAIEPLTKLPSTPQEADYRQRSAELRSRRLRF